jgi:DNA-3-methyladenine glycosylase
LILPESFYARDALVVARALIGTRIVRGDRVARIVETEAYRGPKDLACHARFGETPRTKPIFGPPGTGYVFLVYGMHECFNVVCNKTGSGHAVLIRAAEAINWDARLDGPGKLARELGITRAHNGCILHAKDAEIRLLPRVGRPTIATSPRVGVGYADEWADLPWRFFDSESRAASRPPRSAIGRGLKATDGRARARVRRPAP